MELNTYTATAVRSGVCSSAEMELAWVAAEPGKKLSQYGLDDRGSISSTEREGIFSPLCRIQTASRSHTAFCLMGTGLFRGD
jgi:hypothetical protein